MDAADCPTFAPALAVHEDALPPENEMIQHLKRRVAGSDVLDHDALQAGLVVTPVRKKDASPHARQAVEW